MYHRRQNKRRDQIKGRESLQEPYICFFLKLINVFNILYTFRLLSVGILFAKIPYEMEDWQEKCIY